MTQVLCSQRRVVAHETNPGPAVESFVANGRLGNGTSQDTWQLMAASSIVPFADLTTIAASAHEFRVHAVRHARRWRM